MRINFVSIDNSTQNLKFCSCTCMFSAFNFDYANCGHKCMLDENKVEGL